MKRRDWTDMGGVRETFLTTHWSLIDGVKTEQDKDRALIALLLERYWKPVYCCLRRKGYDNEEAKDLTQGFFHEVVLNRNLVGRADSTRGRFRTFLLHALNQYLADERRKEVAQKRIPKERLVPLDAVGPLVLPETVYDLDPEQSFNYAWKTDLLERVLGEIEDWYIKRGMETHWHVFQERLLQPILGGHEMPSLKELCRRYSIENEAVASNMLKTVKRLFHSVLTKHIQQTVVSGETVEEELQEIFKFVNPKSTD